MGRPSDSEEGECSGVGDVRASGSAAMHALVSRAAQHAALRTAHRRAVMRPPSRRPPPPRCDTNPHCGTGVLPVDIQRGLVRVLIPLPSFVVKPRSESSALTRPAADGGGGGLRGENEEPDYQAMASSEAQSLTPDPPSNVLPWVKPTPRRIPRGNREVLTSHQRSLPLLHCPVGRKGTEPARSARDQFLEESGNAGGRAGPRCILRAVAPLQPGHPRYALRPVSAIHGGLLALSPRSSTYRCPVGRGMDENCLRFQIDRARRVSAVLS